MGEFGPDAMPVVRTQISAGDSTASDGFDGGCMLWRDASAIPPRPNNGLRHAETFAQGSQPTGRLDCLSNRRANGLLRIIGRLDLNFFH